MGIPKFLLASLNAPFLETLIASAPFSPPLIASITPSIIGPPSFFTALPLAKGIAAPAAVCC